MTAAITPEPITLEPDTSEPNKSTQRRALFTPSILAGRQFAREVERASEQRVAALERVESAHADRIERLLSQYRTEIQR